MSGSKKNPSSRSRSRTTHTTTTAGSHSHTRSTIRVRNPDAGVVYHLVFEGSLRKLTGDSLSRHLAAVSGVPVWQQTLFTEEGRRVRGEDDGTALGLADGCTLTLQLPPTGSHRHAASDVLDAWRRRRAQSPAHTGIEEEGNGYTDGYDRRLLQQRQEQQLHRSPRGFGSPHTDDGRTNTYSGTGVGSGRRADDSFAEAGDADFADDEEDGAVHAGAPSSGGAYGPPRSPVQRGNRSRKEQRRWGGDGTTPRGGGRPSQHPSQPPYYPDSGSQRSASASTVPSPADERDVREDFSKIASTPLLSARQTPRGGNRAERPTTATPTADTGEKASRRRASRHHRRHPHRHGGLLPGQEEEEDSREVGEDEGGGAPALGSAPSSQHSSRHRHVTANDASSASLLLRRAAAAAVPSVLAGVTPEEQASMTADELAELLAEREYVWAMEQQRFRTEREHHTRELQRRERELLYEAQVLARQQAALEQETARERRRLAELQAACRLIPPASDGVPRIEYPYAVKGSAPQDGGYGGYGGNHDNDDDGDGDDAETTASRDSVKVSFHRGNTFLSPRQGGSATRAPPYQAPRSASRLGSVPQRPPQQATAGGDGEPVETEAMYTPPSVTRHGPQRWRSGGIHVLGTSRTTPPTMYSGGGDGAIGASSPGGGSTSPLPRPFHGSNSNNADLYQQQPMSLYYSAVDDGVPGPLPL